MTDFNVDDYMDGVSSNYPNSTGYPGFKDGATLGTKKEGGNYYSKITSGGDLSRLLQQIS